MAPRTALTLAASADFPHIGFLISQNHARVAFVATAFAQAAKTQWRQVADQLRTKVHAGMGR